MIVFLSSPDLDGSLPELRHWVALHEEAVRWLTSLEVAHVSLSVADLRACSPEERKALQKEAVARCDALLILMENDAEMYEFVEAGLREKRFYFWENEEEREELAHWLRSCAEGAQQKENVSQ